MDVRKRSATDVDVDVAVVGAGVVGEATGRGLAAVGHEVAFFDTDPQRVRSLAARGLRAASVAQLQEAKPASYLISVPTPTVGGRADLTHVLEACHSVAQALRRSDGWASVVIRSTVPPGTTEDVVRPVLEGVSGKVVGHEFGLSMNPEFLREASALDDFLHPRVIVVGTGDPESEMAMRRLYAAWPEAPLYVMPTRTAEAIKYAANLFNATKISFFNELHRVLSTLEVDSSVAAHAATLGAEGLWNPTYGTRGGAPFGGACLPKDLEAFLGMAEDLGVAVPLLRAVAEVNASLAGSHVHQPPEGVPAP